VIPAPGQTWLYVGPTENGVNGRVQNGTYEVLVIRRDTVWMIQLPHEPQNVDWHGPVSDLENDALWQFISEV
jgi:hypothetical protein